jgi:hypothetical protein
MAKATAAQLIHQLRMQSSRGKTIRRRKEGNGARFALAVRLPILVAEDYPTDARACRQAKQS